MSLQTFEVSREQCGSQMVGEGCELQTAPRSRWELHGEFVHQATAASATRPRLRPINWANFAATTGGLK
jgi:hypothetical protein